MNDNQESITVESFVQAWKETLKEHERSFYERLDREAAERAKSEAVAERRWAKHEKKMAALDEKYGGVSTSMGEHAEQFFQEAVGREQTFGGVQYAIMTPNLKGRRGELRDEYDIVLHNGDFITIIEVKYRFKKKHLNRFIKKKLANFRLLFPVYADKKIYLCIAAFSFEDGVVEEAKSLGVGVLSKDGKNVRCDDDNLTVY
ncbi:hypothetical protein FACS1894170_10540 [Planctomycetales bacterium]|nr:hypothetical protein FACS1894170_10540 [Planctomycetales bacterium]